MLPEELRLRGRGLISNYAERAAVGATLELAPYEAFAILCGPESS